MMWTPLGGGVGPRVGALTVIVLAEPFRCPRRRRRGGARLETFEVMADDPLPVARSRCSRCWCSTWYANFTVATRSEVSNWPATAVTSPPHTGHPQIRREFVTDLDAGQRGLRTRTVPRS
jgi:hypothetical protein